MSFASPVGTRTIAEGKAVLARLLADVNEGALDWNEAETRFQIIDRLLVECLGWPRDFIRLEQPQGRTYSDYELGLPRQVIWEAKREGKVFELPANPQDKLLADLPSILALGGEAAAAIKQARTYCIDRGVEIAVVTNGHQIIAFVASRNDGIAPLEGRCLVINSYEMLQSHFATIWQMLSPDGIVEHRLRRFLLVGEDKSIPPKLSTFLLNYPQFRYPSPLQSSLATISELLLVDAIDQSEVEPQFFRDCYCESGALSQHALVSKQMLSARYAALFDPSERAPAITPVTAGKDKPALTPEIMAEAISQRPIVLIGDVGVGKSSFLKHLMHVSAFEEFKNALYIYIDLGSQGALTSVLSEFILSELERQLLGKYDVDISENNFVRGVYHSDLSRFDRGIYGDLKETNPTLFAEKRIEFLADKVQQRDQHIKASISHLAKARRKQIIIVIDNADQRNYTVQQEAFIIAQNFSKDWSATVFIAVRPQTFYASKQSGALTAYPHRVFTIAPPRIDLVIEKRLTFALNMAEGKIPVARLKDVALKLSTIALFLKSLLRSIRRNDDLKEFLSNITGGNVRAIIEFVTKFIGSANVDAEKIIKIEEEGGSYTVPVHEFWKAALLGDFSYYDPQSSLALNIFDLQTGNSSEHFLLSMILGYLSFDGPHKSKEGFVNSQAIIAEMQNWGFSPASTEDALRRANNKKLIETAQRVTFAEENDGLSGEMPTGFRISTIGAYHLKRWAGEFSYLDAMSYDTPILDAKVRNAIKQSIDSFAISDRNDRALAFRNYLMSSWSSSNLRPTYFNLETALASGEQSFERVAKAISAARRDTRR